MYKATRRKLIKKKGRAPTIKKTSCCELTAIERAFIAGACIAGSLSHNNYANLFPPSVASKSTITRTVQGALRLLDDEQRARVVELTIASQESQEKESWQAIKDGDFVSTGLPNFSVSLHENI
ncbi:uncharacterized protein M421DRAFT_423697, partial [Didymella exigua CBS 183.55]